MMTHICNTFSNILRTQMKLAIGNSWLSKFIEVAKARICKLWFQQTRSVHCEPGDKQEEKQTSDTDLFTNSHN